MLGGKLGITPPLPPVAPVAVVMQTLMSHRFSEQVAAGQLAFLEGRWVALMIEGVPMGLALSLNDGRWQVRWANGEEDASLQGTPRAFWSLARGQADADALFFQRQLEMSGDTELAMELKALLGRETLLPMPKAALKMLATLLRPKS